jgi:hypothetical protein
MQATTLQRFLPLSSSQRKLGSSDFFPAALKDKDAGFPLSRE